jgi:uncharacterized protein
MTPDIAAGVRGLTNLTTGTAGQISEAYHEKLRQVVSEILRADPQALCGFGTLPETGQRRLVRSASFRQLVANFGNAPGGTSFCLQGAIDAEKILVGASAPAGAPKWTALGDRCLEHDGACWRQTWSAPLACGQIVLDTQSPECRQLFSGDFPPNRAGGPAELERFAEAAEASLAFIRQTVPGAAQIVEQCTEQILLREPESGECSSSSSWPQQPGRIGLIGINAFCDDSQRLVEALIHEAVHSALYMLEFAAGPFWLDKGGESGSFTSPWTGRDLPAHSFAHAIVVWAALSSFWRAVGAENPRVAEEAEKADAGFRSQELASQLSRLSAFVTQPLIKALADVCRDRSQLALTTPVGENLLTLNETRRPPPRNPAGDRERVEVSFDRKRGTDIVFRNAWLPNYAARPIGRRWILTSPVGSWDVVDSDVYYALRSVALPVDVFQKLQKKYLILTETNTQSYFSAYRYWTTPHFRHPTHHIIVTTLRCNLACSYCHAAVVPASAGPGFDLSIEAAEAIVDFALNSAAATHSFEFQGGESLLNGEALRRLIGRIRSSYAGEGKEVYLSLQTNATLLTDEWWSFLKQHHVKVGTSLDGKPEIHDSQRRTTGGRATHRLVQSKIDRYKLGSLPTITRNSVDRWEEVVSEQLANGHTVIYFQNVYPINNAATNWSSIGVEVDQYLSRYLDVVRHLRSLWREGFYPIERRCYLALRKLLAGRDLDFADFGNPCGMAHSQIVYHTNGDIYTCDEGRDFPEFRLGNVMEDSYEEVLFGERIRELKSLSIPNDAECLTCAYRPVCSTCPVYDRAATGEMTARHAGTPKCIQTKAIFDEVFSWFAEGDSDVVRVARYHGLA